MKVPANPAPATPTVEDERQQALLAAVEEFLVRTQDYQLATATPPLSAADKRPTTEYETLPGIDRPLESPDRNSPPAQPGSSADTAFANTRMTLGEKVTGETTLTVPVIKSVSIRCASTAPVAPPQRDVQPPQANITNQPLEAHPQEPLMTAGRLVEHLESQAQKSSDLDSEWRLRLVQLAFNRESDATEVSSDLSTAGRTALLGLIRLGLEIRRLIKDPLSSGEEALNRLEELRRVLADRADPIVSSVALCRKVVTFGVYEEMTEDELVAGRTLQTIVYSEIRNLQSEPDQDGQYRTLLGTRLEVLTAEGTSVWQHQEPEIVDRCRRRRNDFFIAQRITLPPTLSPGEFVLKVLVEDQLSGKANEAVHHFTIRATPTRTARR